jgi:beta-glucanase (GH16 family)
MVKQQTRRTAAVILVVVSLAVITKLASAQPKSRGKNLGSDTAPTGWRLVWSDEFNGPDTSAPDPRNWTYDIGVGGDGWGNKELEYYTNSPRNVTIRGGNLVITAIKEKYTGPDVPLGNSQDSQAAGQSAKQVTREYTSTRLKSQGLFAQTYGRFEARIKIPHGQGVWPAFWMLGSDIDKVAWPRSGEIDIMENIGKEPSKVHGSIHGPGPSPPGTDDMTGTYALPEGESFADAFHIYAVEWEPKAIRFYVDDHLYETTTPSGMPHATGWVFDHPFFVLLNLAIGGDWPGSPDASTQFPQEMLVDYVRVYARR